MIKMKLKMKKVVVWAPALHFLVVVAGWWCCDVVAMVPLLSRNKTRCHPASRGSQR